MKLARACLLMMAMVWTRGAEIQFRVPADFEVERAVESGKVRYPMFAAFGGGGELYVAESSGLDLYEELQKLTRRCRISALRDLVGNGRFDEARIFAENLVFPMGLAWRNGKLFVADPPDLITLEDSDGDGRADRRRVLLTGFGHTDNGSLHGLIFGPDGWLYMTMGQPDGYRLRRADGTILEGKSGALIRCREDGSEVEALGRGFENLVEIVFLPSGEIIGTDNWFYLPQEGVRDALVHLVPGGVYPLNAHRVFEREKFFSGELLPPLSVYPAVAHSGLMRYEGGAFPAGYRGSLFSAQFNTRKIVRHQLIRSGASFKSVDEDFLTTDDADFHPSDVLEAADGSMLVVDTGSWYVQHCPTGRIRKAPAEGGIFRVAHRGAKTLGTSVEKISVADEQAAKLRAESRSNGAEAEVRAIEALQNPAPHLRLAAAEALAECGTPRAALAVVEAFGSIEGDPFLRHALTFALARVASVAQLESFAGHAEAEVRRAALVLLDQTPHKALTSAQAVQALRDASALVRRAAVQSLKKHPEWTVKAEGVTAKIVSRATFTEEDQSILRDLLPLNLNAQEVREAVGRAITYSARPKEDRALLLQILADQTELDAGRWQEPILSALRAEEETVVLAAIRCAMAWKIAGAEADLLRICRKPAFSHATRLEALRALAQGRANLEPQEAEFLLSCVAADNSPALRLAAADVAASAAMPRRELRALFHAIKNEPLFSPTLLAALAGRAGLEFERSAPAPDLEARRISISEMEPLLRGGDPNRGQQLFLAKAGCSACHRVGRHGGLVGPDLTRIGSIRAGRDLIESLVAPSATFAQGYEGYEIELPDGETVTGVRVGRGDDAFVLRTASGAEQKFGAGEIRKITRLQTSLMPEGLLTPLDRGEIQDLLAYLQSLK